MVQERIYIPNRGTGWHDHRQPRYENWNTARGLSELSWRHANAQPIHWAYDPNVNVYAVGRYKPGEQLHIRGTRNVGRYGWGGSVQVPTFTTTGDNSNLWVAVWLAGLRYRTAGLTLFEGLPDNETIRVIDEARPYTNEAPVLERLRHAVNDTIAVAWSAWVAYETLDVWRTNDIHETEPNAGPMNPYRLTGGANE
jgi:hypothetical protein